MTHSHVAPRPARHWRRTASWALVALLAAVAVTAAVSWSRGYRAFVVRTGSMTPTYVPGDLVVDAPARSASVGTVITFRHGTSRDSVTTHRVHARMGADLQTKGDANRTPDVEPVRPGEVVGRVVASVPRGGYVIVFLSQPAGAGAAMACAMSVLLAWGLFFPSEAGAAAATRQRSTRTRPTASVST